MKPKPARRPAGLVAFCSRCSAAHMRGSPTVAVAVCTLNSEHSPPSSCSRLAAAGRSPRGKSPRLPCHCHCHRHRLPVPTPAGHNLKLWILKPYGPRSSPLLYRPVPVSSASHLSSAISHHTHIAHSTVTPVVYANGHGRRLDMGDGSGAEPR